MRDAVPSAAGWVAGGDPTEDGLTEGELLSMMFGVSEVLEHATAASEPSTPIAIETMIFFIDAAPQVDICVILPGRPQGKQLQRTRDTEPLE